MTTLRENRHNVTKGVFMTSVVRNRLVLLIAASLALLMLVFFLVARSGDGSTEGSTRTVPLSPQPQVPDSDLVAEKERSDRPAPHHTDDTSSAQGPGLENADVLPHSVSQLPSAELERAYSSMTSEFNKWLSLRTVSADVKITEKSSRPDGTTQVLEWTARLKTEIVPLAAKTNGRRVKIRACLTTDDHGSVVTEDVLSRPAQPLAWNAKSEELSRSDQFELWKIYRKMYWNSLFMMVDVAHDDFQELQRTGIAEDVHQVAATPWALKWTPLRASTPQEEQEFFAGQKQYLMYFFPNSLDEFWFDATTGNFTSAKKAATQTNPWRRVVQTTRYTNGGSAETNFPTSFTMEDQDMKKEDKPTYTTIDFSNVRLNEGVSERDFAKPPKTVRLGVAR